jgi:hypothetical protein
VQLRLGRFIAAGEPKGKARDERRALLTLASAASHQQGARPLERPLEVALDDPLAHTELIGQLAPLDPAYVQRQHGALPRAELPCQQVEQALQLALVFFRFDRRLRVGSCIRHVEHAGARRSRQLARPAAAFLAQQRIHRSPHVGVDALLVVGATAHHRLRRRLLEGVLDVGGAPVAVVATVRSPQTLSLRPGANAFDLRPRRVGGPLKPNAAHYP